MKKFLPILALLLLTACADATKIYPVAYGTLEGWANDNHAAAYTLFVDSCEVNAGRENAYLSKAEGPIGVKGNWQRVCEMTFENPEPSDADARQFFETNFTPYKIETEAKEKGLLTGYYEPILNGSRKRKAPYLTPVYGLPKDPEKRGLTREEITTTDALQGDAPVLLYVDDPIMLFFLHIQGSGKVRLPDGKLVGLQYAGQNGHPFYPIGRYLKEEGELESPSMQGIRDWLLSHPDERDAVMNMNPSYIFFKLSPGNEMAKGALGIPLTPLRSVAIDDDRAAYGVPTYLDATITSYEDGSSAPLQRLFVSQDTGGALRGPHRGDIFFGRGAREEWQAGHQSAWGNVYWLLPVADGVRLRDGLPPTPEELAAEAAAQADAVPPPTEDEAPVSIDIRELEPDAESIFAPVLVPGEVPLP